MQKISAIVAMTEEGVIGHHNQLLWHLPNDFKFFKAITMGKPIIMGRKTFQSIGKPLPGRQNIVLTHGDSTFEGCDVVHSVKDALALTQDAPEIMIIGGGEIYRLFFPLLTTLYITYVHAKIPGSTTFVPFDKSAWHVTAEEQHYKDEKHAYDYRFVTLERRK